MSFHGGLLGIIIAMALFARRHNLRFFHLTDPVAAATPIGLFLGRLANFVNGELYGRPTDVPWAMVFPRTDPPQLPRHPSQLYEAGLEGILLFIFLFVAVRRFHALRKPGMESGLFLVGYGVCRIIAEFFRQPDIQLGYLIGGTTMGQLLSLPMIAFGMPSSGGPGGRRDAARPAAAAPHRTHRAHHRRRVHGGGARPSAIRLLPARRSPRPRPAISSPRRRSARCSASSSGSGASRSGMRWAVPTPATWSSWGPGAAR